MSKKWLAIALAAMLLTSGCSGSKPPDAPPETPPQPPAASSEPAPAPSVSSPSGSNFADPVPVPIFCDTWYGSAPAENGDVMALSLFLWEDGSAEYSYGYPNSDVLEYFEGTWKEQDGMLTLELFGGPVSNEGSQTEGEPYPLCATFRWDYQSRHLSLLHESGDPLLYGDESGFFDFLPFNVNALQGTWTAYAPQQELYYRLELLPSGEVNFELYNSEATLVAYTGWWTLEDSYLCLSMGWLSGQHPERSDSQPLLGTYLVERYGDAMVLHYEDGEILTLNMEESRTETFLLDRTDSLISVDYSPEPTDDPRVILDDTQFSVDVRFTAQSAVGEFTLLALELSEDSAPTFNVTELYHHGTLMPWESLVAVMSFPGDTPAYGISYEDVYGEVHRFAVEISGFDGSLLLTKF